MLPVNSLSLPTLHVWACKQGLFEEETTKATAITDIAKATEPELIGIYGLQEYREAPIFCIFSFM